MTRLSVSPSPPAPARGGFHLDQQLCFALHAATRLVLDAYRPLLDELGLAYEEYLVLLLLWERDGMPEPLLARRLRVDLAAVAPHVDALQAKDLVERDPNRHGELPDLWLTPVGHRLKPRAQAFPEILRRRLGLDPEAATQLRALLHDLLDRPAPAVTG